MADFNDTFTDTNGTTLPNHTSDSGHKWETISGSDYEINDNEAGVRADGTTAIALVVESDGTTPYTPAADDYEIGLNVVRGASDATDDTQSVAFGYVDSSNFYDFSIRNDGDNSVRATLAKVVAGSGSALGSTHNFPAGDFAAEGDGESVTIIVAPTTIEVQNDVGTTIIGPVTDSTFGRQNRFGLRTFKNRAGTLVIDAMETESLSLTETSSISISGVTDSVGSTADRVTSGATVDIALSSAIGPQGSSTVALEDSTGTYIESGTINAWDEGTDTITATFTQSANRFGDTDNVVRVTLDDASEVTRSGITFRAPTGTFWVNGSNPDTVSDNSVFKNAVSAPSAGYQIIWRDPNDVAGTQTADKEALINADGTVPDIASPGDVPVRAWDDSDGTTSSEVTYTATLEGSASVAGIARAINGNINSTIGSSINQTL